MKKYSSLLLVIMLVGSFLAVGCSGGDDKDTVSPGKAPANDHSEKNGAAPIKPSTD